MCIITGSNGSVDDPDVMPPPKPARPAYPNVSPASSLRNLNQSNVSSPPSHWGSASNLPLGYSTPYGVSPQHTMPGQQQGAPPLPREIDLSHYFPSSSGYTQAGQVRHLFDSCSLSYSSRCALWILGCPSSIHQPQLVNILQTQF